MGTQRRGVQSAGCETTRGPRVAGQPCRTAPGHREPEGEPPASRVWGREGEPGGVRAA